MFVDHLGDKFRYTRQHNATFSLNDNNNNNNNNSTLPLTDGSSNNNTTTNTPPHHHYHNNSVFDPISACAGLGLLLLFCICATPRIPAAHYRRGEFIRQRALEIQQRCERQAKLADPAVRRRAIQSGLMVQQIVAIQNDCLQQKRILTLANVVVVGDAEDDDHDNDDHDKNPPQQSAPNNTSNTENSDDNDDSCHDEDNACAICLEPFRIKDVVAWSRQLDNTVQHHHAATGGLKSTAADLEENVGDFCQHVFHQECIESWLMNTKHDECPSCRTILIRPTLDDDDNNNNNNNKDPPMDAHDVPSDSSSSSTSLDEEQPDVGPGIAFVIINGLVSRVRRASYSLVNLARAASFGHPKGAQHQHDPDTTSTIPTPPPPSNFRRVRSLGDRSCLTAAATDQGYRRRSFGWRSNVVVAPDTLVGTNYPIRRVVSSTVTTTTTSTKELAQHENHPPAASLTFRRVSSSSSSATTVHRRRHSSSWAVLQSNDRSQSASEQPTTITTIAPPLLPSSSSTSSAAWKMKPQPSAAGFNRTVSWGQDSNNYHHSNSRQLLLQRQQQQPSAAGFNRTVSWSHGANNNSSYQLLQRQHQPPSAAGFNRTVSWSHDANNNNSRQLLLPPPRPNQTDHQNVHKTMPESFYPETTTTSSWFASKSQQQQQQPWSCPPSSNLSGMEGSADNNVDDNDDDADYDEDDEDIILRVHDAV